MGIVILSGLGVDGLPDGSPGDVAIQSLIAGERIPSSSTTSYLSTKEDWNYTIVDLSVDSTTISAVPAILGNIWVNVVMSAHVCPILDGSTTVLSLPASSAVGATFTYAKGTRFTTSLIVDPDNAATGTIVVQWRVL